MTWLEIMDILNNMPPHLLKQEADLWRYDTHGNYEIMPIHNLVNPNDDGESPEWEKGGAFSLSFQSFEDEPKPEPEPRKFYVYTTMNVSIKFCIQAYSKEDALDKMRVAVCNKRFFDSVKDDFDFDEVEMFDTWRVAKDDVYEWSFDDVDPIDVDSFID